MDIFNGAADIIGWITNLGASATNVIVNTVDNTATYTVDFFSQIGAAVTAGIGSIIYYPILAIISFLALIEYVLYLMVSLVSYVIAPIWFIINFLTGLWTAILQNYSLVYLNDLYTNNSINNFIAAIPGYSTLIIVINASLWLLLSLHILAELKKI